MPRTATSTTAKHDVVCTGKTYVPSVSRPILETRLDDGGSKCDRRLDKKFTDVNADTEPPAAALKVVPNARKCDDSARKHQDFSCSRIQVRRDSDDGGCRGLSLPDRAKLFADIDEAKNGQWASLPRIKKNFCTEHYHDTSMSADMVEVFRLANNITVNHCMASRKPSTPDVATNPTTTFEQAFANYPIILKEIDKNHLEKPSRIQCQAWPILLQGQDLIGITQRGETGTILAFLLPAMVHIDGQILPREARKGPSCLIMAPTLEISQNIEREFKKYNYRGFKCVCVSGGGNRRELTAAKSSVEIVIATPDRLHNMASRKIIDFTYVTFVILHKADRMLDTDFNFNIQELMLKIRPDRQVVVTGTTLSEGVRRFAQQHMANPFEVVVGPLQFAPVHSVIHKVVLCDESEKPEHLTDFLQYCLHPGDKTVVFLRKRDRVERLTVELVLGGIKCDCIHECLEACDRQRALNDFRRGTVPILIATDLESQALDVEDLTHVFNYDSPLNVEKYVYRVGRAGHAGRRGFSVTLVTRQDWMQARDLIEVLEEANQYVPQELYAMADHFDAWKKRCAFRSF
ncbi:probable ATP-dependent RNA helicase DDX43 [Dermacentor albipictus]|uniref:probable ATP-dependent RNA helicase DDX43 n=1 Tax=Dermacentor albipictus TaxID=60249 RepID=UPI0031FCAFCC